MPNGTPGLEAAFIQGDLNVPVGLGAGHGVGGDGDHRQHGPPLSGHCIGQEVLHGDIGVPGGKSDGFGQVHADASADAQNHIDLLFGAQPNALPHLAQQRLLSGVHGKDLQPGGGQAPFQFFIVPIGDEAAGGHGQKPLAQLCKLRCNCRQLTCAVENTDAAVIDEILHQCCAPCAARPRPIW